MKRLAWLALVALAVLPYLRSVGSPLLYDDRTLLDNRWLVREAGPVSVFQHDYWFGTRHAGSDLYRPLTVLSLGWNLRAMPTKEGIRAVNIAGHAVATLALFWLLGTLVSPGAAWMGAALFAVHPLASEAVLWAVGRAEIFAALFGLVAFVLFTQLGTKADRGRWRAPVSVAAFFAALCFKESASTWLVIGGAWLAVDRAAGGAPVKRVWARALPYGLAFATYYALRASAVGWGRLQPPGLDNPLAEVDGATRAANAVLLFARYVWKMLLPRTLSVDYGFDQIPVVPLVPWAALGALAIAASAVAAVIVLIRSGHKAAAFLLAFVPCAFAVTGNLAFPIGTIFAERLAYTPLLGACGLAGWALASIPKPSLRAAAAGVLVAALGARTVARCGDFRSLTALSEATAEASPRAVKALVNAGRTRLRLGDPVAARPLLERAVGLRPDYAGAWRILADTYAALGDEVRAGEARARASAAAARATGDDEPL